MTTEQYKAVIAAEMLRDFRSKEAELLESFENRKTNCQYIEKAILLDTITSFNMRDSIYFVCYDTHTKAVCKLTYVYTGSPICGDNGFCVFDDFEVIIKLK